MKIEVLAGVTTFITIAYILILNPQILSDPYMIMGDTVMAGKISNGVAVGLIMYCFIKLFTGKARDIKALTWIISLAAF